MKNLFITIACLIICYSCSDDSTSTPVPKYQKFDFYFDRFNIVDDGNSFGAGKFYYTVEVTDKNGNILKDVNGNDVSIIIPRNQYISKSTGEQILVNKQFYGVSLKKEAGEKFTIMAEIWDRFESGADDVAGIKGLIYEYPWDQDFNSYYALDLVASTGSYKTQIVYKVDKR
jgi:hypothetical protein